MQSTRFTSQDVSEELRAYLARYRKPVSEIAELLNVTEATIYRRLNEDFSWPFDDVMVVFEWAGLSLNPSEKKSA